MLAGALLFSLVPVVAAAISGAVAALLAPGARVTSGLQHLAAGVVFAAAAIELLPGVLRETSTVAVLGFGAGIAVMFGFRAASGYAEKRRAARGLVGLPLGLLAAIAVDFLIDGVILGAGFAADSRIGALLTVALAVEYLFVGLSLAAVLAGTVSTAAVAVAPVVLALLTVLGTALGVVLLSGAAPVLVAGVLAFGAVAFMYLATEELLVQAHASGETAIGSVGFFVGFLLYLVLHQLIR